MKASGTHVLSVPAVGDRLVLIARDADVPEVPVGHVLEEEAAFGGQKGVPWNMLDLPASPQHHVRTQSAVRF
jgi:hypothetical protein